MSTAVRVLRAIAPFIPVTVLVLAVGVGIGYLAAGVPSLSAGVVTLLGAPLLVVIAIDLATDWFRPLPGLAPDPDDSDPHDTLEETPGA